MTAPGSGSFCGNSAYAATAMALVFACEAKEAVFPLAVAEMFPLVEAESSQVVGDCW